MFGISIMPLLVIIVITNIKEAIRTRDCHLHDSLLVNGAAMCLAPIGLRILHILSMNILATLGSWGCQVLKIHR